MAKKATAKTTPAKRGRPKGSKTNLPTVEIIVKKTECPVCGSTKRDEYNHTRTLEYASVIEGKEYSKVIWRNTKCLDCGQSRIDKAYE
jgi:hypothetical protein